MAPLVRLHALKYVKTDLKKVKNGLKKTKKTKMVTFRDLPVVLQDMCTDFAWKIPFEVVDQNLDELLLIKRLALPPMFYRMRMFHRPMCSHIYSPLDIYVPFWSYHELFNVYRIKELLYNLDFRKKYVKSAGSRYFWLNSFEEHYLNIMQFGMFYKILLACGQNIWTPTYNWQLRSGHATHFL